jgi:hypothetical protein
MMILPALHDFEHAAVVACTHGLLNCLTVFVVKTPHVMTEEPKQVVVQKGYVQTIGRMGEHFMAKLFNFPRCQVQSERVCIIMLKNEVSFHWAVVTKCTLQFLGHQNIVSYNDSFLSGQEIKQYASLSIYKDCSHNFSS